MVIFRAAVDRKTIIIIIIINYAFTCIALSIVELMSVRPQRPAAYYSRDNYEGLGSIVDVADWTMSLV